MNPDQILDLARQNPQGISVSDVMAHFPNATRRTAQRYLKQLVDQQRLRAIGAGRGRRYVVVQAVDFQVGEPRSVYPLPPHSADSEDALAYVSRPLNQRVPVSYQHEFLDAYVPNKSEYLPAALRRQLRLIGETPLAHQVAGTHSRAILDRLLIDLSWASSHLEGNTYTRLDTRELILQGHAPSGKAAFETQMILNHKAAIELLVENAESIDFDRFTVLNLHSALAENLLPNPKDEGRLRQHAVEIGQSVYLPLAVPDQLEARFSQILHLLQQIRDPFEQAFFAIVHIPYLQPFADINKRTSRLAANIPLIKANLCPLTFLDVPVDSYNQAILAVYEMTRIEPLRDLFVWAYERSTQEYLTIRQSLVEPDPLRLRYRQLIKATIKAIVLQPQHNALDVIDEQLANQTGEDHAEIRALIIEELRRLHEGVLARYGLRPSEYEHWRLHRHQNT